MLHAIDRSLFQLASSTGLFALGRCLRTYRIADVVAHLRGLGATDVQLRHVRHGWLAGR